MGIIASRAEGERPHKGEQLTAIAWCGILAFAIGLKLWLLIAEAVPFNADEAVVGLMARHILAGRWPTFFYGQAYMGSLDATLVAGVFALLGPSVTGIRLVQIALYAGTVLTTMMLARRVTGSQGAALVTGLLMAVPTLNVTLYSTASLGGYGEALLIGNLLFLLALRIANGKWGKAWPWVLWGLLAGLGFWAFGLTLIYIIPTGMFLARTAWQRREEGQIPRNLALAAAAALVGGAPWLIWAWGRGLGPLLAELMGSAIAGATPGEPLRAVLSHIVNLLLFGVTVTFGLRPPWAVRPLAVALLPLAVLFWIAALAGIRGWPPRSGQARVAWRLMMGMVATLLIGFVLTPFGADPSGRYFVPLWIPLAIVGGGFVAGLWGRGRRSLAVAGLLGILIFHLWGTVEAARRQPPGITTQFDPVTWIDHSYDEALVSFLQEQGETRGYTNYWVAYPLAFLSDEELIYVPRLPYHLDFRYTARDDRYAPYGRMVEESDHVAYITTNHPQLDDLLRRTFRARGISWKEVRIGSYRVFYGLSRPLRPGEVIDGWLAD